MAKSVTKNQVAGLARTEKPVAAQEMAVVMWEIGSDPARITVNDKLQLFVDGKERSSCTISTHPSEGVIGVDEKSFAEFMAFLTKTIPEARSGFHSAFLGKVNGALRLDDHTLYIAGAKKVEDSFYQCIFD